MALPLSYNVESVRVRWRSTIVAVLGIAGTVGVFVAMLALSKGFEQAVVASGSPQNAKVRRAGATSEIDSLVTLEQVHLLEDQPEVMKTAEGPLVSPEVVNQVALPLMATGTEANVQVRGVTPRALLVHENVKLVEGRFLQPGLYELVVGRSARDAYRGLEVGDTVRLGGGTDWKVVGVFESGGTAFDSEVWGDPQLLNSAYNRPVAAYQTAVARLTAPSKIEVLKNRSANDPRMKVQIESEREYYRRVSSMMTTFIEVLGSLVAVVMGLGAVFGALNTMYAAVAERTREIATIRALGFGAGSVVASFVLEALLVAGLGGLLGCLFALPVNGITTQTMNFQTFSHLAFAFRVTPPVLLAGLLFALLMGIVGGLPPAVRAARLPIARALRDL